MQKLADPAVAIGLFWLLSDVRTANQTHEQSLMLLVLALLVSLVLSGFGIYRSWRERSLGAVLGRASLAWLVLMGLISAGSTRLQVQPLVEHHHLMPWSLLLLSWLLISHTGSRLVLRRLRAIGQNSRRDGYIGSREGLWHLRRRIRRDPWRGHRIVAAITWPRAVGPGSAVLRTIQQFAERDAIDQWIIEDPGQADALTPLLTELAQHTCPVLLIPAWLREHHLRPQPAQVAGLPALQLWDTEATPLKLRLKYGADKLLSLILLIALTPLLLLLALCIQLDSPGPVLFSQRRYGEAGRPFQCLKFRTMQVMEDGDQVMQARRHDPRVTRVGRWLRRLNLDELPQLLNVLRGEMSLVGPRPHAAAHNEYYRTRVEAYMRRHTLRPGLTGWAQILGHRGETRTVEAMDQRVRADLDYIHNWSLLLDLEILLLTVVRWSGRNAF